MFRRIKSLFSGGDAPLALDVTDLPGFIAEEETGIGRDLETVIAGSRAAILAAREDMEGVLGSFDAGSMEEVSHRKLAGVTEKSLPLFIKAMRMSLSRDLPGDPEGFYAATGEVLKGCLSAFRGQGRYLAARFPAEMKILREGVDAMGREANAMTAGISRARERRRDLAALRDSLAKYRDERARAAALQGEIRTHGEGVAGSAASLERVRQALADLEAGQEFAAGQEEARRIGALSGERDEAARLFRAAASPAAHLVGKGEKLAARKGDREVARLLGEAAGILDMEPPLPGDRVPATLSRAMEALASLAGSGELVPKNREETDLLGSPSRFLGDLAGHSSRFRALASEIASAEDALRERPALVKHRELRREADRLTGEVAAARERLARAEKESAGLREKVPSSLWAIRRAAEKLLGKTVRITDAAAGLTAGEPAEGPAGRGG